MVHAARLMARLVLVLSGVASASSLLLFGAFLVYGSWQVVDLGFGRASALGWDLLLSLLFFIQHSVMARAAFQRRLEKRVPAHYKPAVFALASAAVLFAVLLLWQPSDVLLVSLSGLSRALARGMVVVSVLVLVWGVRALGRFDPLGLEPIRAYLRGRETRTSSFRLRGPYRLVRHPLYLGVLLLVWSSPDLTADRLLFNLAWSAWIVAGSVLEERDLVAQFGNQYRCYQRTVPMLLPWPRRPLGSGSGSESEAEG